MTGKGEKVVMLFGQRNRWRVSSICMNPPHGGCAGGRIGTRFLRPRGTSPLKGGQPRGNLGV